MKLLTFTIKSTTAALIATLLITSGCATQSNGPSATAMASADVDYAVSAYTDEHNYHRAVSGLENALNTFKGDSFEQSTLTALAAIHLDYGNREAFLETTDRLEMIIGSRAYIPQHTQHVLAVAFAMRSRSQAELPGRGYDYAHVRAVYALLGAGS